MNDNTPAACSGFAAWLPVACLALSAAAFGMGAPARIARGVHRGSTQAFSAESAMRYEPVIFPMPAERESAPTLKRFYASLPAGPWRGIHEILGRQIASTR
jgi:hypothetical protein